MSAAMALASEDGAATGALLVAVGEQLCAIPLAHVVETMRPLPTVPLDGAPAFIAGLAVIRGRAMPVADLKRLLHGAGAPSTPARFVTLALGSRQAALAVDRVVGIRRIARLEALPPLLRDAAQDAVAAVAVHDAQMLVVLEAARLVPDPVWALAQAAPGGDPA
jgi:purine-binding chemotaxis protein CheW